MLSTPPSSSLMKTLTSLVLLTLLITRPALADLDGSHGKRCWGYTSAVIALSVCLFFVTGLFIYLLRKYRKITRPKKVKVKDEEKGKAVGPGQEYVDREG
ncbi:hypothetical protein BU24DRAFT_463861 [Aaosphaeria arxii CBS 175.79]|uniref:Uncharacterized protein n=1 Tax=Aaosphaeria arxii CBS 175.79 TaxID=1450172 RepID=A0A6A5XSA1_9PLEO|nr:uncharacterized protein BU24DRAFT_463861 [Aaosphaeria arxii CBS 175.79]KAF2015144.1 hypothetical protein BU24DRAFT_463861 [Aaosphaeria arxii CBS 175.79]